MHGTSASSTLVIDANVAVWAVLPVMQQASVDAAARVAQWRRAQFRLFAPALWLAEATSAVRFAVYARSITLDEGLEAITDLFTLPIQVFSMDAAMCQSALRWAGHLGQRRAYDSFYLALAEQLGVEFWTADKRLANSAQQAGATWVRWIGES